jgi:glycosyltransferase involved in cell wall biosynthesis
MKIISANAPYGEGGLGGFLATVVEEARATGELECYYSLAGRINDQCGRMISLDRWAPLFRWPPYRWHHSWRECLAGELFDRAVARRLATIDVFHGFGGTCLRSFRQARRIGIGQLIVESATSHIDNVWRQHRAAAAAYPIEESWLSAALYRKTLREYALADAIVVSSEYARHSFLARGVPAAKVRSRIQTVGRRFTPPLAWPTRAGFNVIYVGRLQVTKGVPVLMDAFARLEDPGATLTLVGGTATEEMDRYLRHRLAADRRITIAPGDPLPYLHRADVLVHPTYEDGLALAPMEALACGVPVLVTDDTGMKEHVSRGHNGFVLPTGDVDSLVEHLRLIRSHPLRGTFQSPRPADRLM